MHGGVHGPGMAGPVGRVATALLVNGSGQTIGQAELREGPTGVLIRITAAPGSLSPGWHGAHFHQVGTCADTAAGFQASGPHVRHGDSGIHGLLNPDGPEAGDLPNIFVPGAGDIGAEMFSTFVTLADAPVGGRMSLLDADGSALVIHANVDDHATQPIGGAGARVACGVIVAS
jgi:Cu-Zn family superoxide dismutase